MLEVGENITNIGEAWDNKDAFVCLGEERYGVISCVDDGKEKKSYFAYFNGECIGSDKSHNIGLDSQPFIIKTKSWMKKVRAMIRMLELSYKKENNTDEDSEIIFSQATKEKEFNYQDKECLRTFLKELLS